MRILNRFLVACASTLLVGCSFGVGDISGNLNFTELPVPEGITYDGVDTVSWLSVSNCDGYTVRINNQEYNVSALKYTVSLPSSQDFLFSIKARGKSLYTSDSPWSESYSFHYEKRSFDSDYSISPKALPTPKNITYTEDHRIVWDQVEHASSYLVQIQLPNGPIEDHNASINYLFFEYYETVSFKYRVKAIAEVGDQYDDSPWSVTLDGRFVKDGVGEPYSIEHSYKGLGQSTNLFDESKSTLDFMTGASVLDKNKLTNLKVGHRPIYSGNVVSTFSDSLEKHIDDSLVDINVKASLDFLKPGQKKIVSQKKLGISLEYKGVYSRHKESETKITTDILTNYYENEELYFEDYRVGLDPFRSCLSSSFLSEASRIQGLLNGGDNDDAALQSFINTFGTHVITSEILGSQLKKVYTLVGTKAAVDEKNSTQVGLDVEISKNMKEFNLNADVKVDINHYSSSEEVNVNFRVDFLGGKNAPFVTESTITSNFLSAYASWVESTNDPNNSVMINVPNKSLICVWDLLDEDEYRTIKAALKDYTERYAGEKYRAFQELVQSFYLPDDGRIQISTPEKLVEVLNRSDSSNIDAVLTDNIDMSKISWNPVSRFEGKLDGDGKVISNFHISTKQSDSSKNKWGMFREFAGELRDITFDAPYMDVWQFHDEKKYFAAGLVAGLMSKGVIENVAITNTSDDRLTIRGYHDNDTVDNSASSYSYVGGFVGELSGGTIKNCRISGVTVFAESHVNTKNSDHGPWWDNRSKADTWCYGGGFVGYQTGGTLSICNRHDDAPVKSVTHSGSAVSAYHCFAAGITGMKVGGTVENTCTSSIINITAAPDISEASANSSNKGTNALYNS